VNEVGVGLLILRLFILPGGMESVRASVVAFTTLDTADQLVSLSAVLLQNNI